MLYTILCYNDEDVVWSQTKDEDQAMMAQALAAGGGWRIAHPLHAAHRVGRISAA
jgi:hypothetical protein